MSGRTISDAKFTYSPDLGLLYDAEPRDTQTTITERVKSGDINLKWLKAQLAHYQLRVSGNKQDLAVRLTKAASSGKLKNQPKDNKELEKSLKAAYEARLSTPGKVTNGGITKATKSAASDTPSTSSTSSKSDRGENQPRGKRKESAALHAAIIAGSKKAYNLASLYSPELRNFKVLGTGKSLASKPPWVSDESVLGHYALTCEEFPEAESSLFLKRHPTGPRIIGEFIFNFEAGKFSTTAMLDWPKKREERFFTVEGIRGEIQFRYCNGQMEVEGRLETATYGDVDWNGTKSKVETAVSIEPKRNEVVID
ncbi:Protein of unknown function [Pyronema omphalodes CBS 100304]|uniref:SAP domain-containing protein n=1 Tax=Pyronema omphalodes (strain CBS 100304) TaxID=1076935 RepID=U4LLM2_PYROM|nr:Protein of unknown function [Pyronema omphalodes CBS 100304]